MAKNPRLEAAPLEKEKFWEDLETENVALKEALATKEKEVEEIRLENEELKATVKMLSKSLKEMENNKLKDGHNNFTEQEKLESAAFALKECLSDKEKEVDSIRLEKEELKKSVELLSKSLMVDKKMEVRNEEMKARVEVNPNKLEEGEKMFIAQNDKENISAPCFTNLNPPSTFQGSYPFKFHGEMSQSNRPSSGAEFKHDKDADNAEDANQILSTERKSISLTSVMKPNQEAVTGLSLFFANLVPPSHTGTKAKSLFNQENETTDITPNAFVHDKNIDNDNEGTNKSLFSAENISAPSPGVKHTLTSKNPDSPSRIGTKNGPAIYIPDPNVHVTNRSVPEPYKASHYGK